MIYVKQFYLFGIQCLNDYGKTSDQEYIEGDK